ncbi:unnamed protein product, partial [Porites evermanni]
TIRRKERRNTQYTKDRTPFLITFNPALRKIFSVLKKHLNILQQSPPLTAKTSSLFRQLLFTDVTQAFVTFWYTSRSTTAHFTRNNLPEFLNATIHAVSPVISSRKEKQITSLPQLKNKEKSLTTYPANPKILST